MHGAAQADEHVAAHRHALANPAIDLVAVEQGKIKGAIRTDFVLSAEILVIALGVVAQEPFAKQVAVLVAIATLMTVGVYGLVAAIVKLDDLGLHWLEKGGVLGKLGAGILWAAPWLMKTLSVVGTAAMFLVGGGILVHGVPAFGHWVEGLGGAGGLLGPVSWIIPMLINGLVGVLAGGAVVIIVTLVQRLRGAPAQTSN